MNIDKWNTLCSKAPVLLDGGWGSLLQDKGLPAGEAPEMLNITQPGKIEILAREYVEAGSEIILTNTFGGNGIILEKYGLSDRVAEINRAGALCSRKAAGSRTMVFGSMGPTGKILMMGDVSEEEMYEAFSEQALALQEGGVDGLVVETMSDLQEAALAVKAAASTHLPVVACMVFDSGPENDHTMMGISPGQAAATLQEAGAWAVGANCGRGPEDFFRIIDLFRKVTDLPLWVKPNAGLPQRSENKVVYPMKADEFAEHMQKLAIAGAVFVGGCCGTNPEYIRAVLSRIQS